mgnify:CR=1 FL=1
MELLLFGILRVGLIALLAGTVPIRGRPEGSPLTLEHYLSIDNCKTTTATASANPSGWASLLIGGQNYLSLHVNDWAGASAGALPA